MKSITRFWPGSRSGSLFLAYVLVGSQGAAQSPEGSRTDRHNNPTAMTTGVAHAGALQEGKDYETGDPFTDASGHTHYTAKLFGDPVDMTMRAIDNAGFFNQSGKPRWDYLPGVARKMGLAALNNNTWAALSRAEKAMVINRMYNHEGGTKLQPDFRNYLNRLTPSQLATPAVKQPALWLPRGQSVGGAPSNPNASSGSRYLWVESPKAPGPNATAAAQAQYAKDQAAALQKAQNDPAHYFLDSSGQVLYDGAGLSGGPRSTPQSPSTTNPTPTQSPPPTPTPSPSTTPTTPSSTPLTLTRAFTRTNNSNLSQNKRGMMTTAKPTSAAKISKVASNKNPIKGTTKAALTTKNPIRGTTKAAQATKNPIRGTTKAAPARSASASPTTSSFRANRGNAASRANVASRRTASQSSSNRRSSSMRAGGIARASTGRSGSHRNVPSPARRR